MDTSKHVLELNSVNAATLQRERVAAFFPQLPSTVIALEACNGSHQLARQLQALGHKVKLIARHQRSRTSSAVRNMLPTRERYARR